MQMDRIGTHKTSHYTDTKNVLRVVYHNTEVVKVKESRYAILNNGGWYTVTSKTRMNQASREYHLGFVVYQENFNWYVKTDKDLAPYYNGIVIDTITGLISRKLSK